ncbi:MAG: dihydropteroate synthase [Acidimicrobiaceae bacterium]|nr:dihydropteroate synthase [Acidimicrobiaceae bacterium]
MGVVNVTPDSFSDGGECFDTVRATARGSAMIAEGADIIDIGGESTRPGAQPVPEPEELRRVVPVLEALAAEVSGSGVRLSVDTRKAGVARAAVAAGASIINDVSAQLWPVAAETGAGWIAMHLPADPAVMQDRIHYDDVVREVRDHLVARAEAAAHAGVRDVWIDPGLGFGKHDHHNLLLLRHLDVLVATGWPVAVGSSRKGTLGRLLRDAHGRPAPPGDRLEASVATATWAALQGAALLRVHDVRPTVMALQLAQSPRKQAGALR